MIFWNTWVFHYNFMNKIKMWKKKMSQKFLIFLFVKYFSSSFQSLLMELFILNDIRSFHCTFEQSEKKTKSFLFCFHYDKIAYWELSYTAKIFRCFWFFDLVFIFCSLFCDVNGKEKSVIQALPLRLFFSHFFFIFFLLKTVHTMILNCVTKFFP